MSTKTQKSASQHKPSSMPHKGMMPAKGDAAPKKKVGTVQGAPDYMCGSSRCEMKGK